MLCPTCFRDGYEPPKTVSAVDEAYRAERRAEVRERVTWMRNHAAGHEAAGRVEAAKVWRDEADSIERHGAHVWGSTQ